MVVAAQPLVPEPLKKRASLVNANGDCTIHRYVRSELVEVRVGGRPAKAYAFIFRCDVTGAERRYGIEPAIWRPVA